MGEKIVVGPINQGLTTARTAFVIDNDSFPTLINAYQWRGQVKRKRGTSLLNRLKRFFNSTLSSYGIITSFNLVAGLGNILTGFSLETNGNIVLGTVSFVVLGNIYTDPDKNGALRKGGIADPGSTINYATGDVVIFGGGNNALSITTFNYYPDLPVMGLEDFVTSDIQFPGTIAFDTKYSYNILTSSPYPIYDVSFYKNPITGTYSGYIAKTNETPTSWNGKDYQQFWTVNYQGALWTTNGIPSPFSTTNIGMQFSGVTNVAAPIGNTVVITVTGPNLVVGDFVYLNEFDPAIIKGINFQTGYIIAGSSPGAITIKLPNATLSGPGGATILGIVQYLTNRSDKTKDCLRFYDGDPTDGNPTSPSLNGSNGWVNFSPPLSQSIFSIADLPAKKYYLVGARLIVPYKDRLLFLGPVIQSSDGSPIYLQDTVIYSQNGTPYYTASYTDNPVLTSDNPTSPLNLFLSILVPTNQTATSPAYFEDSTGFGGFISAGIDKPINSVGANEDALICGFNTVQAKLLYTGSDIVPFTFYIINSELGTSSAFSAIVMDEGVISRGNRGFIMATQNQVSRIDLSIPDQVFQINLTNNGTERICSQRDYINEWIYFTYASNQQSWTFPNQTLQFNYRDNSWAIFNEAYTTYGSFRKQTGFIWSTVGLVFNSWRQWTESWDSGSSTLEQPLVIAGNHQGFIMVRDDGTGEGNSIYIRNISTGTVTSPSHTLNEGDFIIISGVLGTVGPSVNDLIFSVSAPVTTDTFTLNPVLTSIGTYLGGGLIKRMYVPFVQTKQFPVSWGMGRKTRLGVQQYLLETTEISQIQLLIFLSQNNNSAYNLGGIVPSSSVNNSLIYSTVLYTCPESTNLGLTPANINLQTPTAIQQQQIWHRINTSLIGDTVQLGFTLSDDQMRSFSLLSYAITGVSQSNPCILTTPSQFENNSSVTISGVLGMTQLNGNSYAVLSSTTTTLTINVDSTAFTPYISGGIAYQEAPVNQFAEIIIHGFILDVNPSQSLS